MTSMNYEHLSREVSGTFFTFLSWAPEAMARLHTRYKASTKIEILVKIVNGC